MDQFVTNASPVVALVASALGLLIAIDKLTLSARLQRKVAFLRSEIRAEKDPASPQVAVLNSMRRAAVAKLVAQDALGTWLTLAGTVLAVGGVILATFVSAAITRAALSSDDWLVAAILLAVIAGLVSWMMTHIGLAIWLGTSRYRLQIVEGYLAGQIPLGTDESDDPRGFRSAGWLTGGLLLISCALGAISGGAFAFELGRVAVIAATLQGIGMFVFGFRSAMAYAKRDGRWWRWQHPFAADEHPNSAPPAMPGRSPYPEVDDTPSVD